MNSLPFRNWRHIGQAPNEGFCQYERLWRIEVCLRHFVCASLRRSFGTSWRKQLEGIRINDSNKCGRVEPSNLLQVSSERQRKHNVQPSTIAPRLEWFLTTNELVQVISKCWEDCFQRWFEPNTKKDFLEVSSVLMGLRNAWAHFRPLPPKNAEQRFSQIENLLSPVLIEWMARYWNSDPITASHWIAQPDRREAMGLPISIESEDEPDCDAGWSLRIQENDAKDCLWVTPFPRGMSDVFELDRLADLAQKMDEIAIHVAFNFYPDTSAARLADDAAFNVRVSIPNAIGPEAMFAAVQQIGVIVLEWPLRRCDKRDTDPPFALDELLHWNFYEAPSSVMVNPSQEGHRSVRITIDQPSD